MSFEVIQCQSLLEAVQRDRLEEVKARLANEGEDVNTVFLMNRTALHCAVARCNTKMVEVLLKHNVDLKVSIIEESSLLLSNGLTTVCSLLTLTYATPTLYQPSSLYLQPDFIFFFLSHPIVDFTDQNLTPFFLRNVILTATLLSMSCAPRPVHTRTR